MFRQQFAGRFDPFHPRVNVEERPDLAERFRIDVVPTLLVIEGHRVARRIVSPDTARDLARALDPWLQ